MLAACSRKAFFDSYCKEHTIVRGREYTEENAYDDLKEYGDLCAKLGAHIWEFHKTNGIEIVP